MSRAERDRERVDVRVRGLVQGVGFRWFVRRHASALGLEGWVANEADGSVAIVAEGAREDLEALLAAVRRGPPGAHISSVEERRETATGGFSGFAIRHGAHRGD